MNTDLTKIEANTLATYTEGLDKKLQFCAHLLKSGLVPQSFKTPEAVFAVVLQGQELGFSPMQALNSFHFIQGKVTINAAGMLALIQSRGGSIQVIEESDKACTLKGYRPDRKWEETFTFTLADAAAMGLSSKDNWKKMPKFMLYARCVSVLCRRGWADALAGIYSSEEMQDALDITPNQVAHQALAGATKKGRPRQPIQMPAAPAEISPTTENGDRYYYDLSHMQDDAKAIQARKYIEQHKGIFDEKLGLWVSPVELPKLVNYQQEA